MNAIAPFALLHLLTLTPPRSLPHSAVAVLVDAAVAIPGLRLDLRYSGAHNVAGARISTEDRCWLRPEAVAALRRAEAALVRQGLTLLAWDCYRSRATQQKLWDKQPTPGLVANPKFGSNHNRGVAIDLTLAHADGTPLELPTDFDDFTPTAARDAKAGVSALALANRAILRNAMVAAGFTTIRREWWHFDLTGARGYGLLENAAVGSSAR